MNAVPCVILLCCAGSLAFGAEPAVPEREARMIDFTDPTYGGRIRQIWNPAGDEHDLYHYRCVFNADNSRLLGIETPKDSKEYRVTLYDGDGQFLKKIFTVPEYDWRLAWDRRDPKIFYTCKGASVHRYDVETGQAQLLGTFEDPQLAGPSGLSLNEKGDRLLLRFADKSVRTYRLPALDDERVCRIEIPEGSYANWDKLRFPGHGDFFALTFEQKQPLPPGAARVLFHSNGTCTVGRIGQESSGTIDQCILYLD